MKVLLVSTYELGHQPFGLASPAAWLAEVGAEVSCLDLAVESLVWELPMELFHQTDAVADAVKEIGIAERDMFGTVPSHFSKLRGTCGLAQGAACPAEIWPPFAKLVSPGGARQA